MEDDMREVARLIFFAILFSTFILLLMLIIGMEAQTLKLFVPTKLDPNVLWIVLWVIMSALAALFAQQRRNRSFAGWFALSFATFAPLAFIVLLILKPLPVNTVRNARHEFTFTMVTLVAILALSPVFLRGLKVIDEYEQRLEQEQWRTIYRRLNP
jgi:hypothetical protein